MSPARDGEVVCPENMRSDWTRILDGMYKYPYAHETLLIVRAPLKKVVVHDIILGTTTHYNSAFEASKFFKRSRRQVTTMISKYNRLGSIVARRYIVQYEEDWRRGNERSID